ncbi:3 -5 exonuclease protein [Rutstroemia sp. NJR-2017a BVV2]|nr:3 -5 exonuclease protein [Rutstroemia sp. NJR-2017a BVV2]
MGSITVVQECSSYMNDPYGFDDVYDSRLPEVHRGFTLGDMSPTSSCSLIDTDDETSELPEVHGDITLGDMSPISSYSIIDTADGVSRLIDDISLHIPDKVSRIVDSSELTLFLDVKGVNLGRGGTVSILQIRVHPTSETFLVDIYRLGWQAFTTPGKLYPSETMKSILSSSLVPKVFFDVRNGPSALFSQFKISVENVLDIQLMEFYTRDFKVNNSTQLMGFWECLTHDPGITPATRATCRKIRDKGRTLFAPNHGGRPEIFNLRPLNNDLKDCIIQDLILMSVLYDCYIERLTISTRLIVEAEVKSKLMDLQSQNYPKGNRSPRKYGY